MNILRKAVTATVAVLVVASLSTTALAAQTKPKITFPDVSGTEKQSVASVFPDTSGSKVPSALPSSSSTNQLPSPSSSKSEVKETEPKETTLEGDISTDEEKLPFKTEPDATTDAEESNSNLSDSNAVLSTVPSESETGEKEPTATVPSETETEEAENIVESSTESTDNGLNPNGNLEWDERYAIFDEIGKVYEKQSYKIDDTHYNIEFSSDDEAPGSPIGKSYCSEDGWPVLIDGTSYNFVKYGVVKMWGYRYTWYTSVQLYHHKTAEWIPCDDGFYRTNDGYIVVASKLFPKGTIVMTPFGKGMVLDYCATNNNIDIYTHYLDEED